MNGLLLQALQQPVFFVPIGGCCRQVALCIWKKIKIRNWRKSCLSQTGTFHTLSISLYRISAESSSIQNQEDVQVFEIQSLISGCK